MLSPFVKIARPKGKDGFGERWGSAEVAPTLNLFDYTADSRAVIAIVARKVNKNQVKQKRSRVAYSFNPQASLMFPFEREVGQVLTVCHQCGCVEFRKKGEEKCQ